MLAPGLLRRRLCRCPCFSCRHGAVRCRFGGNEGHDPHILYTLSALQILALLGELHRVDKEKVSRFAAVELPTERGCLARWLLSRGLRRLVSWSCDSGKATRGSSWGEHRGWVRESVWLRRCLGCHIRGRYA